MYRSVVSSDMPHSFLLRIRFAQFNSSATLRLVEHPDVCKVPRNTEPFGQPLVGVFTIHIPGFPHIVEQAVGRLSKFPKVSSGDTPLCIQRPLVAPDVCVTRRAPVEKSEVGTVYLGRFDQFRKLVALRAQVARKDKYLPLTWGLH